MLCADIKFDKEHLKCNFVKLFFLSLNYDHILNLILYLHLAALILFLFTLQIHLRTLPSFLLSLRNHDQDVQINKNLTFHRRHKHIPARFTCCGSFKHFRCALWGFAACFCFRSTFLYLVVLWVFAALCCKTDDVFLICSCCFFFPFFSFAAHWALLVTLLTIWLNKNIWTLCNKITSN